MPAKTKPQRKPVAKIDPREHLDRLVDDITNPDNFAAHDTANLILENIFGAVLWHKLDPDLFKGILRMLYDSTLPELQTAMIDAAINEHRAFCSCCRRHMNDAAEKALALVRAVRRGGGRIVSVDGKAVAQ